ncbi:MAG: hypothetical protein K9G41_12000 [Flavobacteriales bacterium]|nr:hypothetical protein [Flavobacteriales bacterium]
MGERRVPKRDDDFNSYIQNTTAVLAAVGPPLGYVRLGLSLEEFTEWDRYANDWKAVFPRYTDLNTRTKTIKDEKNIIKQYFTEFSAQLLTRISASPNLSLGDRNTFNLPERAKGTKRGKITDVPYGVLEPVAMATVNVRMRMTHDAKRSSMNPLSDGLELRWIILDNPVAAPKLADPTPVDPVVVTSTVPPSDPMEMPNTLTSTKALFRHSLPASASGKRMFAYARWVNQSNPANNGEWSALLQTNIL